MAIKNFKENLFGYVKASEEMVGDIMDKLLAPFKELRDKVKMVGGPKGQ